MGSPPLHLAVICRRPLFFFSLSLSLLFFFPLSSPVYYLTRTHPTTTLPLIFITDNLTKHGRVGWDRGRGDLTTAQFGLPYPARARAQTQKHTRIHTHIYIYIYTHINTHTHTYIHTLHSLIPRPLPVHYRTRRPSFPAQPQTTDLLAIHHHVVLMLV